MTETIAEIAAREAAEAEADDEGRDEPEPTPEPEPEPEPAPEPASDAGVEKAYAALGKEGTRHAKRVEEIMGPDFAALGPCPCCEIAGFVFPFDPASPDDAMRRGAVDAYFGTFVRKLKPHPDTETCVVCDGEGFCETGGKREGLGFSEETCPRCNGQGWLRKDVPTPPGPAQAAPSPAPAGWTPPGAPPKPELVYDYVTGTWQLPA